MRAFGGLKTGLIVLLLVSGLSLFALQGINAARHVDRLSQAYSGDGLWHISQVEVDYRRLTTALATSKSSQDYGEIRHRFDVFFSRILTLREGGSYQHYRSQDGFSENLEEVMTYLTSAIPYIDGDDAKLSQELDMLIASTDAINGAVRHMALAAVANTTQRNEALREETREILLRLIGVTLALIAGLILLIVVLRQMYGRTRRVSEDNKRASARIASMIHASLDGILVTDPDGNLLEMNHAAERVFQTRLPVFGNLHLNTLLKGKTKDGRFDSPENSGLLAKGRIQALANRKNGSSFPVEVSLVQANDEGRSDIYVAYVRDISSLVETEDSLRQARDEAQAGEKAKARLLAVMSHEIRTPLNGVLGAADLLSKSPLDPDQQRYVDAMQTSGGILQRHVNDVLELSRLDDATQTRQRSALNLHQLVPEIVESQRAFAAQSETQLEIHVHRSVPKSVLGDRLALQQALLNLVGNAIKFSAGGNVCVEVDHVGKADVIEFRVIDDGIGISEVEIGLVFEDFYASDTSFARRKQGTGLGLGITKRIVTAIGGQIGAESIPGEGSMFWFRLPMQALNSEVLPTGAKAKLTKTARPSEILLVEDNAINRMIATDMLQNAGHKVSQAKSGAEGVALAGNQKFDLILMDISMPDMDGLTAANLIRHSKGPSNAAPIVALTAQSIASAKELLDQHGIQKVLQKPLTSQTLTDALETILVGPKAPELLPDQEPDQKVLNLVILQDVITNIGVQKTRQHFEDLQCEMEALTEKNGPMVDTQLAHKLAGAAAVLGLCALHRHMSQIEHSAALNGDNTGIAQEWHTAREAFLTYLQNNSDQHR